MKFDTNDLVYAYLTMQEADNDIAKFEYYCTDDGFLEKYDDLSKNQKKRFFELLEQAIETIEPVGETIDYFNPEDQLDDLRRFHNQLDTLFYEFG